MWRLSLPLRVHILSPMSQPLSASGDYQQRLRRLSLGTYLPITLPLLGVGGWGKFSLNRALLDPSAWCDMYHQAYRLFHL